MNKFLALILTTILLALFLFHLLIGPFDISIAHIFKNNLTETNHTIFYEIRLPRALSAILVGACLSLSGLLLQGMFRNPLASPDLIGSSAGGLLGVNIVILSGASSYFLLVGSSFIGSFFISILVYLISFNHWTKKSNIGTMILTGVALTSLCGSISSLLLMKSLEKWDLTREMVSRSFGSLENFFWPEIIWIFMIFLISFIYACLKIKDLNLMNLGDETAQSLGVNLEKSKAFILLFSSLLAGVSVAFAGIIGFIGLICPHITRKLFGNNYFALIPGSILLGSVLVLLSDVLCKWVKEEYQMDIKIGIITSFLGAPFFLYLIIKNKRVNQYL